MTPEHLELYRQLSETKMYRERFGEWFSGDMYVILDEATPHIIHYVGHCDGCEFEVNEESPIHIPHVFDPENPERCLWGIVDWDRCGCVMLIRTDGKQVLLEINKEISPADRLDIALIKIILKQEKSDDNR